MTGEGGEIENPELVPPLVKILLLCKLPQDAPDKPEMIKLDFVKGIPVAFNGEHQKLSGIILALNEIGAKHGVGVTHHIEDRVVGLKVRGVYEAPAAHIIIEAHRNLEKYVCTRTENEFKSLVDTKWAYMCYGALWLDPLMGDLNAFIDSVNHKVTGRVTIKLYKGVAEPVAVETPNTIFEEKLATFNASVAFNQNVSAGFIELYTLQMRLAQRSEKTVLLSIGNRKNKLKLLSCSKLLNTMHYKVYATYKTHKFLKTNTIEAILVNKISHPKLKPNLLDLLRQNRFDLVINIFTSRNLKPAEKTDGQTIREYCVKNNAHLITDVEVAKNFVDKLHTAQIHSQS